MPRLKAAETLERQLSRGREFSLDVLCRLLVPWNYRNTMQATNPFMEANTHLLEGVQCANPGTGREVGSARLRESTLHRWDRLDQEQHSLLAKAKALFEAGLEVGETEPVRVGKAVEKETDQIRGLPNTERPSLTRVSEITRDHFVRRLVAWIEEDLYQPVYRGEPQGKLVKGWAQRLRAYFWPSPLTNYRANSEKLAPLLAIAARLAERVDKDLKWTPSEADESGRLAIDIFEWGGVPQPHPSSDVVRRVFTTALHCDERSDAPLNSGWTKVAAFATAHLEDQRGRHPQAIWDSRVATAITSRLDRLLTDAGISTPRQIFPNIGTVTGLGGTRPRQLSLRWPNGYRSWVCQFAASRLIEEMRDILNSESHCQSMPLPEGAMGRWTVRGVEMVLFGDGY